MKYFNSACFMQYASGLILLALGSSAISCECTRTDIDHYLDRGFTPDQVTKICSPEKKSPKEKPATTAQTPAPTESAPVPPADLQNIEDKIYLKTVIDAEEVELNEDHLSYIIDRCLTYGEERFNLKDSACVVMKTRIARNGLKVINTVNPIMLLRDAQLLISAQIHREITFKNPIKAAEKIAFEKDYPRYLQELNLPLKRGIMPDKVAKVLKRIAK